MESTLQKTLVFATHCFRVKDNSNPVRSQALATRGNRRTDIARPIPKNQGLQDGGSTRVGYARVSTQDQSAALQIDALKAAGCKKVFVEAVSGASSERPKLWAALRTLKKGDTLVVWKLDRLARSFSHLLKTVNELDRRGVGFISLTENIDTVTAGGRLVLHIFGALAEFERAIIRERTMAGLEAARVRGRVGGRPRKLSDSDLKRAKVMLTKGDLSVPQVAKELGVSVSTLYARVGAMRAHLHERSRPAAKSP